MLRAVEGLLEESRKRIGLDRLAALPDQRLDAATGIRLVRLDAARRWAEEKALWPIIFGLACCSIEMLTAEADDPGRFLDADEVFRTGPRQADLMILSGRLDGRMAYYVRGLLNVMAQPRLVIGLGNCLRESAIHHGIHVDLAIDGCPPRAEDLRAAILSQANHGWPATNPVWNLFAMNEETGART
jgi:NADH-quinone oxidoreductase subunit B